MIYAVKFTYGLMNKRNVVKGGDGSIELESPDELSEAHIRLFNDDEAIRRRIISNIAKQTKRIVTSVEITSIEPKKINQWLN